MQSLVSEIGCTDTAIDVGFSDDYLGPLGRANVTTARDVYKLLLECQQDVYREVREFLAQNQRNNRLALRIPESTRVEHKTGSLEGVVNDAGVIRSSRDLAVVVLTDHEQDPVGTARDIGDMVGLIWEAYGEEVEW